MIEPTIYSFTTIGPDRWARIRYQHRIYTLEWSEYTERIFLDFIHKKKVEKEYKSLIYDLTSNWLFEIEGALKENLIAHRLQDDRWLRLQRNGKTKRKVRPPHVWSIPCKIGSHYFLNLTESRAPGVHKDFRMQPWSPSNETD